MPGIISADAVCAGWQVFLCSCGYRLVPQPQSAFSETLSRVANGRQPAPTEGPEQYLSKAETSLYPAYLKKKKKKSSGVSKNSTGRLSTIVMFCFERKKGKQHNQSQRASR